MESFLPLRHARGMLGRATAGFVKEIHGWLAGGGDSAGSFAAHRGRITAVVPLPEEQGERLLVTSGQDGAARLWRLTEEAAAAAAAGDCDGGAAEPSSGSAAEHNFCMFSHTCSRIARRSQQQLPGTAPAAWHGRSDAVHHCTDAAFSALNPMQTIRTDRINAQDSFSISTATPGRQLNAERPDLAPLPGAFSLFSRAVLLGMQAPQRQRWQSTGATRTPWRRWRRRPGAPALRLAAGTAPCTFGTRVPPLWRRRAEPRRRGPPGPPRGAGAALAARWQMRQQYCRCRFKHSIIQITCRA